MGSPGAPTSFPDRVLAFIGLGDWGAVATIASFFFLTGGILLTQVRKTRGKGRTRQAIDEVVIGVPEVKDERTGRVIQPERPGLIDRMDDMDTWRKGVDTTLGKILTAVTPNGGNADSPADTSLRIEKHIKQIADASGVELDQ